MNFIIFKIGFFMFPQVKTQFSRSQKNCLLFSYMYIETHLTVA